MDAKKFNSTQEEISYWRDQAQSFKQQLEETREELEEFQISSRELEAELEAQLEQLEKKNNALSQDNSKLKHEVESLKEKLELLQGSSHKEITELERDLAQVRAFKDELQKYIRELEQSNDDLERAKRATVVSLEDFEMRLNQAIERNAFLESELDEKESLSDTVQRLKDEARDLRQELDVRKRPASETNPKDTDDNVTTPTNITSKIERLHSQTNSHVTQVVRPDTLTTEYQSSHAQGASVTPNKGIPTLNGGTPLTPSARISALNIVGDLLRKVGALESKLASCRNFVKEPPRGSKAPSGNSPVNSPRTKRLTRAAVVHPQPNVKISV